MHLALLKALVAVISASVIAIGVAVAPIARKPAHARSSNAASRASTLETDGLEFLGQLAAGNVKPDARLKQSWTEDVTAVAHSLGLTDRALADQLAAGRSLSQIAASRGVPMSTVTSVLLAHVRGDFDQAERDQAISPTAARAHRRRPRWRDPARASGRVNHCRPCHRVESCIAIGGHCA